MIRIAYVIDTIETPAAGTERQLIALLQGLDRGEFAPHLICLRGSAWLDQASLPVPVTAFSVNSFFHPASVRDLVRFRALCRRERFHIVQTFFWDAALFGTLGARLAGCGVVVASRRNLGHWEDGLARRLLRWLRGWTHGYLANSEAVAARTESVEGVDRSRIRVIPNGVRFEPLDGDREERRRGYRRAWGVPEDAMVVGCVANLRSIKNLSELVTALGRLLPGTPGVHAVIIGEGDEREDLERRVRELGLSDRVHLVGRLPDAQPALAAFDVAVQCSLSESSSNSLIEYMAAGLPVVASDIPGNAETIRQEDTGLLYPIGDAGALAQGLGRLIHDDALARRLGVNASSEARRRYSMDAMLAAHSAFYRQLAEVRKDE